MKTKWGVPLLRNGWSSVFLTVFLLAAAAGPASAQATKGEALSKIIAGARQEGVVDFSAPSSLTPKGAQALIEGVNKAYGLDLKINYVPATSYARISAQLITEESLGQSPSYDLTFMSDFSMSRLYERHILESSDWRGIFSDIPPKAVMLGGTVLHVSTRFALPAYNTRMVPAQEVPQKWEDVLNPRWKGKLMIPSSPDIWIPLAQKWGEARALRFVKGLRQQNPVILRYPEISVRLQAGEFPLAAAHISSFIFPAQLKGAPVAFAEKVSPVPARLDFLAVLKNARHPNAAKLLAAFSLTPAGQAIWGKTEFGGRSSILTPGSPAWKFAQGKDVFTPDLEFMMHQGPKLLKEYSRILGMR